MAWEDGAVSKEDAQYFYPISITERDQTLEYVKKINITADTDLDALNRALTNGYISIEQIFNYIYYLYSFGFYCSPEFFTQHHSFIENDKKYDGIITGISYTQKGINVKQLPKKFFNFACASQDLFYDYEMMKYALKFDEVKENIKYAIIGLCYYSFQYDLSKGTGKNRSNYYYTITGQYHNYDLACESVNFYNQFCETSKRIFKSNFNDVFCEMVEEQYIKIINEGREKEFDSYILNEYEKVKCINEVKKKFNKDYPFTVEENKKIFKDYLDMLYTNNIMPIVVVPPQTEIYRKNISISIRDEFYEIINEFQKKHGFQFLDYFYSEHFIDSDFYDFCHLNNKGSKKLTEMLSRDINW